MGTLAMSIYSPAIWNSPMKKSSISTVCDSRPVLSEVEVSSSISEMPNSIGAWKISHRPDVLREKPEPILLKQIFDQVTALGCIHAVNVHSSPP
jgi:hypothetical protein